MALSSNFYKKYTFKTWNAVEISYNEIYCRKGIYFSFDFSWYSIHLDIVCQKMGFGRKGGREMKGCRGMAVLLNGQICRQSLTSIRTYSSFEIKMPTQAAVTKRKSKLFSRVLYHSHRYQYYTLHYGIINTCLKTWFKNCVLRNPGINSTILWRPPNLNYGTYRINNLEDIYISK